MRTQQRHQRQVNRPVQLHRTTNLGQPHLHTHGIQPSDHVPELITIERPLILSHHHSIKLTISTLGSGQ
ncbi:hypothetical protein DMC64_38855 [Amycolatopsis sp. WAC 04197]|nr:hypothetical protein DMC64_38855 [Amycolatopsis sp. WAC 04197]